MARVDPARAGLTVRCAIYTRKSSDEGLEQEFNSLDAQREACEAYIVSQRHVGWVALADMFDDDPAHQRMNHLLIHVDPR
jgi:site-specific DNA recombinase